jgi:hypothetical protein
MVNTNSPLLAGITQQFGEIQQHLGKSHVELTLGAQKDYVEAHQNYLESLQKIQEQTRKELEQALGEYTGALQGAYAQQDAQSRCQEAHQKYLERLQRVSGDAAVNYQKCHSDYVGSLRTLQQKAQQGNVEAYRAYLQSVKDAWAQLDVHGVTEAFGTPAA